MKLRDLFIEIGADVDSAPLDKFDRGVDSLKSNLGLLTAGLFGATGAAGGLLYLLGQAGALEQVNLTFEVMLGGIKKAKVFLKDLYDFALKTPFEIKGLEESAKLLLGMGFESNSLTKTLNYLGNVAAGLDRPLKLMAWNLGQIKTQGRLTGRELRDFAGIPLIEEIAKILNVADSEIKDMVSRGEIGFDLVEQAFINMTSAGGRFNNLMARQSLTLLGMWSNVKDVLTLTAREIGTGLLPEAKGLVKQFLDWADANKKLIRQKGIKLVSELAKGLAVVANVLRLVINGIGELTEAFGGLGNTIKWVMTILLAHMGLSALSAIGNITLGVMGLAKAFFTMGRAAAAAQLKAVALPLAVGIMLAALVLIIQDIISYFQGKDSLTGILVNAFENKYPAAFEVTKNALNRLKETFSRVFGAIKKTVSGVFGDETPAAVGAAPGAPGETLGSLLAGLAGAVGRSLLAASPEPPSKAPYGASGGWGAPISISAPMTVTVTGAEDSGEVVERIREEAAVVLEEAVQKAYDSTKPAKRY